MPELRIRKTSHGVLVDICCAECERSLVVSEVRRLMCPHCKQVFNLRNDLADFVIGAVAQLVRFHAAYYDADKADPIFMVKSA